MNFVDIKIGSQFYCFENDFFFVCPNITILETLPSKEAIFFGPEQFQLLKLKSKTGYWSREFNCKIDFLEPNEPFIIVEIDYKYIKIFGKDKLGWVNLSHYNLSFLKEFKLSS
jgi:hypothetical protein